MVSFIPQRRTNDGHTCVEGIDFGRALELGLGNFKLG